MIFHEIRKIAGKDGDIINAKVLPSGTTDSFIFCAEYQYSFKSLTNSSWSYDTYGFKYSYEGECSTTSSTTLCEYMKCLILNYFCRIIPLS